MHLLRPRANPAPSFGILAVALFASLCVLPETWARGLESQEEDLGVEKAAPRQTRAAASTFGVSNSNCPGAACDTVWVGHSNAGPGGAFLGVRVGGAWDFDTGIAGTDSSQGWKRWALQYRTGGTRAATDRPEWYVDIGNHVNEGNTNLWAARDLAARKYVKTGVAGVWHSDDMVGVKLNVLNGAEPSALPIVGARSAWCGLRESGNTRAQDALTGNYINGDLQMEQGGAGAGTEPEFPGFCNGWDQLLYKDFAAGAAGSLSFRIRANVSEFVDPLAAGSGWFNPDPTNIVNLVNNTADSVMVYIGSPRETGVYDTNRRWFSEVLDLTRPHQELFAVSGQFPFIAADTAITRAYAGIQPIGGNVRVVFRVKTNRVRSDQVTGTAAGYNTKDGAALIDAVQLNGGTTYGFEAANSVTARSLIANIATDGGAWATTGKPPSQWFHLSSVASLLYEDLCGGVGAPTRICDLAGVVAVAGDKGSSDIVTVEQFTIFESPTIDLAVRTAAPGTKNGQGIDKETASRTAVVADMDIYTGFMSLDESVFWRVGARAYAPAIFRQPVSGAPIWSNTLFPGIISANDDPFCFQDLNNISAVGFTPGQVDSLKYALNIVTQGWRFGGTNLGNTRGTYFDRFRVGFVRASSPLLGQAVWDRLQDQFPFNEGVSPGDNALFDTTTAFVKTANRTVAPQDAPGVVAGDSIMVRSEYTGNGIATGTRVDLIFRIDWGPGSYTVKGNRSSALVNKDPAHPFAASYLANNGPFGTPGGHGGTWNRHVWNSARMDSAEINTYPINPRAIGNPVPPQWMGTLHESEFGPGGLRDNLGIVHGVCFLVNPEGPNDETNTDCSGSPPAVYGAVSGLSEEGTKILPDGWFTPGTHIEYFVRRSTVENLTNDELLFDTLMVTVQDLTGNPDFDQERFTSVDVLPDMWKSTRYLGAGLACFLMIDANDRRGGDPPFRGAADSLGYGKNNGASQGWKGLGPGSDPNNPAGFVAANLGQYGLNYDHYDIEGSESSEAGHPGVRFANNPGAIAAKGDKSGPSAAQLATLYTTVLFLAGDNSDKTLHDGFDTQESADDISLLGGFLDGASGANRRGVWLSGDGIMEDGVFNSDDGTILYPFLTDRFGADLTSPNYKAFSGSAVTTVGYLPTASWAHPGRTYGFNHLCTVLADVLQVVPTLDGATEAAQYQHLGPGPWTSSVYRPVNPGTREYRTLFDGFDLFNLRGNYASLGDIATKPGTDLGRISWFDDVVTGHFQICARRGPVIGVGDLPGTDGRRFVNANLGSFPNPAFAGSRVTLRFTLAQARDVKVKIYNVAGREVANFLHKGVEGPNDVLWDGVLSSGAKASPGVYFYRLDGIDFERAGAPQKMILLGSNQ